MPSIRRATADDAEACHEVIWTAVTDLRERKGTPLVGSAAEWWASGESLQRFLANQGDRVLNERGVHLMHLNPDGEIAAVWAVTDPKPHLALWGDT